MPIKLNGLTVPFEFSVLEQLSQDVILGMNFLNFTQAKIDCTNRTITFFDDMLVLNTAENFKTVSNLCCVTHRCVIPPRSESIVQLSVRRPMTHPHDSYIFEPVAPKSNQKFLMARALVQNRGNQIVGRILNPTNDSIYLYTGMPLGKLAEIEPGSIVVLPEDSETATNLSINSVSNTKTTANAKTIEELGIKIQNESLLPEQKQRLVQLIEDNSDIFAMSLADLPGTSLYPHAIDTGDSPPVRQRAYRHNPVVQKEIQRQTQEMLDHGIIEPSMSKYNAPCLLVKKKGGESRLVIDFRALNKVTRKTSYPLPVMSEITNAMAEAQPAFFSSVYMKSGYHQISLNKVQRTRPHFRHI